MKAGWLVLTILCSCGSLGAQSQMTTGVVEGVVTDATGGAPPGVTVTLRHMGIGISRTYRTATDGRFTAAMSPPNAKRQQPGLTVSLGARPEISQGNSGFPAYADRQVVFIRHGVFVGDFAGYSDFGKRLA